MSNSKADRLSEAVREFAEAVASNHQRNLTMRQIIDSFNVMAEWINGTVLPVIHDITVEMIDAGFYLNDNEHLAFDPAKSSEAYIAYRKWRSRK
jgi:hypothetical protein